MTALLGFDVAHGRAAMQKFAALEPAMKGIL